MIESLQTRCVEKKKLILRSKRWQFSVKHIYKFMINVQGMNKFVTLCLRSKPKGIFCTGFIIKWSKREGRERKNTNLSSSKHNNTYRIRLFSLVLCKVYLFYLNSPIFTNVHSGTSGLLPNNGISEGICETDTNKGTL